MTTSAIVATGLRKSFGDHVVLDGIDLDVTQGGGEVTIAGHDLAR